MINSYNLIYQDCIAGEKSVYPGETFFFIGNNIFKVLIYSSFFFIAYIYRLNQTINHVLHVKYVLKFLWDNFFMSQNMLALKKKYLKSIKQWLPEELQHCLTVFPLFLNCNSYETPLMLIWSLWRLKKKCTFNTNLLFLSESVNNTSSLTSNFNL